MMVSRAQVDQALRAYLQGAHGIRLAPTGRQGNEPQPAAEDTVTISRDAQRIARYVAQARQLPDVRPERVAQLKAALAAGRYQVSAEAVATKMLERLLVDAALTEGGA